MEVSLKHSLVLEGARARLKPLMKEVNVLRGLLGLEDISENGVAAPRKKKGSKGNGHAELSPVDAAVKRNRKPLSAAARKAIGARMKKYWAEKRKAAK